MSTARFICNYYDETNDEWKAVTMAEGGLTVIREYDTAETAYAEKSDELPPNYISISKLQELTSTNTFTDPPIS